MAVVRTVVNPPNGSGGYAEAGFIPPVETIERIEVIRGPMSSLYGSDAMGGVINIITKAVADEWQRLNGYGRYYSRKVKITVTPQTRISYVSGPLIKDKLGLQVYGGLNYRREDKLTGRYTAQRRQNITAKLAFTPVEGQKFLAGSRAQHNRNTHLPEID